MMCLSMFAAVLAAATAPNDWENLEVNSINRLEPRSYSVPLKSESDAFTTALEPHSPYKLSLNGTWKLSWTGDPKLRVKDFHLSEFDDSRWFPVEVPGCLELQGFGSPHYTNQKYPQLLHQ